MEQYIVTGMSCAACSSHVEKAVSKVPGVTSCSVNLLANSGSRRNRIGRGNYRGGGKGRIWGEPERTREKKRGMGEYGDRRKSGRRCFA